MSLFKKKLNKMHHKFDAKIHVTRIKCPNLTGILYTSFGKMEIVSFYQKKSF